MRAAIVMPAVFGFADGIVGNPETTLFSAFGSFAMLVLADFGGAPRRRLVAYVSLAMLGAVLIVLGTVCSQTGWLAVVSMGVVGFTILFGRLLGGYFASGAFAALLIFILAVGFPGPTSVIPDRLEGWFLASAAGIAATMLIWPARRPDQLRRDAARACRALADLIDPVLYSDPAAIAAAVEAAGSAVRDLRHTFVAAPLRPTRPTGPTEAVAFTVDALEWLLTVASPAADPPEALSEPCQDENAKLRSAAGAVLRASAENLEAKRVEIPLGRLERASDAVENALTRRIGEPSGAAGPAMLLKAIEPSIRTRDIAYLTREIGVNALRAIGAASEPARSASRRTLAVLRAHATLRSASFRNAFRGSIGLATAVFVIQVASVQRGFWVTLATLSVLRSTALGTGATILQALAGTIAGIAIGGAFVYAIGTNETVLWAVLPLAVLLAAYSSRAMTFGAGQAGFTVTLVILFNIIVPTGWTIGLVRVEDVAIGCAISLVVGLLFWPRGIESLVRESLGTAYELAADYVLAATRRVAGGDSAVPEGAVRSVRTAALDAAARLDDAFRQYLAEPSAKRADLNSLATLVSGAIRVRLGAFSLSTLSPARSQPPLDRCGEALTSQAADVRSWYDALAAAVVRRSRVAPPQVTSGDGSSPAAVCVRDALARQRDGAPAAALSLLWADQHIDALWRLGAELAEPTAELAGKPGDRKHGRE